MGRHYTTFTPEGMCALGQQLAEGAARRTEYLDNLRLEVHQLLTRFEMNRLELAKDSYERRAEYRAASAAWHSSRCHMPFRPRRRQAGK